MTNQFEYREAYLRIANKIRRQRDYWQNVAGSLRTKAQAGDPDAEYLIAKAEQLDKCAGDLDFIVQKAIWPATSEDKRIILHGTYPVRD